MRHRWRDAVLACSERYGHAVTLPSVTFVSVDTWLDTLPLDTGTEGSRPEVFWSGELSTAVSKGAICCYIGCYSLICYKGVSLRLSWGPPIPW